MPDTTAALSLALQQVGDRWTLLVVAALLDGPRRFGELHDSVVGIATNVLSSRLRDLEREGLVLAHPYSRRPLRFEYELTSQGSELAGAVMLLAAWGAGRAESGASSQLPVGDPGRPTHSACGTPLELRYFCPTCLQIAEEDEELWA
ncbi:MAG: helix-turn-helix domain-containing protein [Actinomycetota bacterium]|nr:helix-turn-helix domain-containing protein [Actinomycetota bacterium]